MVSQGWLDWETSTLRSNIAKRLIFCGVTRGWLGWDFLNFPGAFHCGIHMLLWMFLGVSEMQPSNRHGLAAGPRNSKAVASEGGHLAWNSAGYSCWDCGYTLWVYGTCFFFFSFFDFLYYSRQRLLTKFNVRCTSKFLLGFSARCNSPTRNTG